MYSCYVFKSARFHVMVYGSKISIIYQGIFRIMQKSDFIRYQERVTAISSDVARNSKLC
jgi:hypothetical protein